MQETGGVPVTNYVVERLETGNGVGSEEGERWTVVSRFLRQTEAEVGGLMPGRNYSFRVSAVNEVGRGDPLETVQATLCKRPPGFFLFHFLELEKFMLCCRNCRILSCRGDCWIFHAAILENFHHLGVQNFHSVGVGRFLMI